MGTVAIGQFADRASAEAAGDALLREGFSELSLAQPDQDGDGVLLVVRTGALRYADACLVIGRYGGELCSETAPEISDVVQSVGTSPGATGYPDPPPAHVGDDPGLIDTPIHTRTGTTATTGQPPRP
jgi:hypothetical protein